MADPSDMLHKPKQIAEPTLFPLLVWARCQSWRLKTCQSASLFVSRSFQCNDSQVLTLRRPVCQLWSSLCIWPAFLPLLAQEKPLGEAPLLTWPLGKAMFCLCSVSQVVFFPRLLCSRGFMVEIWGGRGLGNSLEQNLNGKHLSFYGDVLFIWSGWNTFHPEHQLVLRC